MTLSQPQLENLASTGGVAYLNVFGADGRLKVASEPHQNVQMVAESYSLFDLCPDYQSFFASKKEAIKTPFMPSIHDESSKFVMMADNDADQILEAGVGAAAFSSILNAAITKNKQIENISLYTPTGVLLASTDAPAIRNEVFVKPQSDATWIGNREENDAITFSWRIAPTSQECCECVQQGYARSPDGFFYRLTMRVSTLALQDLVKRAGHRFVIHAVFKRSAWTWSCTSSSEKVALRFTRATQHGTKNRNLQRSDVACPVKRHMTR